jgi:hypothetical protein
LIVFLVSHQITVCIYENVCFISTINLIIVLRSIHYAKSIKILNTLTTGASYIQPPVVVIEYDELSLSDLGKGTLVEVIIENISYVFACIAFIDHI